MAAQLATLAGQTMTPFEIVVGDDSSTDETVRIVEDFAATAPCPVRIVRNSAQLGYRRNFMNAARLCTGDIVAFCDQDDLWLPEKLERCVAALADPAVMLVVHDAAITDADGRPTGKLLYRDFVSHALANVDTDLAQHPWPHYLGLTQVFRRILLDEQRCDNITDHLSGDLLAHDQIVPLVALERGRVHFIPDALVLYRQHGRNVAGVKRGRLLERWKKRIGYLRDNRAIEYRHWAAAAHDRCEFLRRPARPEGMSGPFASPAVADRYADLAHLFRLRERLYVEAGLLERIRVLLLLSRANAYSDADLWHLPSRTWIRDAVFGILLQPWLRPMVGQRRH